MAGELGVANVCVATICMNPGRTVVTGFDAIPTQGGIETTTGAAAIGAGVGGGVSVSRCSRKEKGSGKDQWFNHDCCGLI